MRVRLLGPVAAGSRPSDLVEPPGLVPAAVLAHLALANGHVLPLESLTSRVWDAPPDNPRNAVQAAVSRLRRTYGDGLVETTRAGYRLRVDSVVVDAVEAEALERESRARAATGSWAESLHRADGALRLFAGLPLAGLESHGSEVARTALEDLRRRAGSLRCEALLALGRAGEAVPELRAAATSHPFDEPLHALLMRALAADGRPTDALTVYDQLRRRLADELGTDPASEVSDTFAAILAGTDRVAVDAAAPPTAIPTVSAPRDVAIALSDVVGSGRLWREHPDAMPAVMLLHHRLVAEVVAQHHGTLPPDQGEGDARLAVFASPTLALAAAGTLQRRLADAAWPPGIRPHVRLAITTGSVVEAGGNVFGVAVHRCSRLRALAWGDQVLVARDAAELARDDLGSEWLLTPIGRVPLRDFGEEEVLQLDDAAAPRAFPAIRSAVRLPNETSPYVGRRAELDEVSAAVRSRRLVTLTGIGGSGKTRLAVRVARDVAGEFPGGVVFVDLATVSTADEALDVVAATTDPRATRTDALDSLQGAASLLVLDNLEQVAGADHLVRTVLAAGGATVLATSRRPVGLVDEVVVPLGPMSDADATELLRLRAHDVAPELVIGRDEALELVRVLGSVPLAVELAASRLRVLDVAEVTEAVSTRLAVLRGGADRPERQQAVAALISDSWDSLTSGAVRLLVALALFRRGATAPVVAETAGLDTVDVLDVLDDLVGRGLVRTRPRDGSAPRFVVVELVRRFALDTVDPVELRELRSAHARASIVQATRGGSRRLAESVDDVRAAVRTLLDDDVDDPGLRLDAARLALGFGWWTDVVALLEPLSDAAEARNSLGVALLRRDAAGDAIRGRSLLESAAGDGDADAASALGGSLKRSDADASHRWYLEALRLDPGDPYALGNVVEHELAARGPDALAGRSPSLVAARDRRQVQVDAGADLPWAAYDLAKLHLWLGEEDGGLHALLDAVSSTTHARQVETTLASFERVAHQVGTDAWATAVEVLRLALLVHGDIRSSGADDVLRPPVLVLAGASAADAHADVMGWTDALVSACDGRGGSVVSGGTASGVSALAPVVARAAQAASVGYLPSRLPRGVHADESYDALRRTDGRVFSLREPTACWEDLLAAGVRPDDVHMLGIGGGQLTALELHLATAVGANVAVADVGGDAPLAWSSWHRPPRAMVRDAAVLRRWLSA